MEHLIAKGIDRVFKFRHLRRIKRWKAGHAPFVTGEHLRRFSIVASIITGTETRVAALSGDAPPRPYLHHLHKLGHTALLADHGFPWTDGETIFLPLSFVDMTELSLQEELAKVTLFFLSYQIKSGSLRPAHEKSTLLQRDQELADIYWIVENGRLFSTIQRDFPKVLRNFAHIQNTLMAARPPLQGLTSGEARVEELLRGKAGGAPDTCNLKSPAGSLRLAVEIREGLRGGPTRSRRYRGMVPFTPWGKFMPGRIAKEPSSPLDEARGGGDKGGEGRDGAGPKKGGKAKRFSSRKVQVDEEENEKGLALNIYDKLISWTQFVNVTRPFDDDPEEGMGKRAESMEELVTADIERSTSSFFDADLEKTEYSLEDSAPGAGDGENIHTYNEWDWRKGVYRDDFSRVIETVVEAEGGGFVEGVLKERHGTIMELRRQFEALTPDVKFVKRQIEGDLIDIDSVVEAFGDLKAGGRMDEKLYIRYKRAERDLSALFLVDLSMSTDTWVGDKRIIDHEKEALVILSEAMSRLKDRHAIYGFSGQKNTRCRFFHIKGFDEEYNGFVRGRIGSLVPLQYTRMGPAIRRASDIISKESSAIKLLFIISDGKPNDVDCYEGKYGIEDTRMAVKEAQRGGIIPFCLTVDSTAGDYLTRLFGPRNFAVLPGAERLVKALPELYARIVQSL
ncbi:MAG: nitric oxide reductase activation protein NorD [Thermodesulfobacteriota bacterium]